MNDALSFNEKYKLKQELVEKLKLYKSDKMTNSIAGKPKVLAIEVLKRFFTNPVVVIATIVFLALILTAIIVTFTSPFPASNRFDSNWKDKGYVIEETTHIGLIPPRYSPMKTTSDSSIKDDIARFTDPNYEFYEYLKNVFSSSDYKFDASGNSVTFNYYKFMEALTLNSLLNKAKTNGTQITQVLADNYLAQIRKLPFNLLFGTTSQGYDIWTTVWAGTLESIWIALFVATVEVIIGISVGAVLGFHAGKWIDTVFMRVIEIFQSPPSIIWLLMFVSIWGTNTWVLIAGLLFVGWTIPIGATRLFIITVKDEEYILAAKSVGASKFRQIFIHALPAIIGKLAMNYVRRIPSVILSIASLAFLGFFNDKNSANLGKFMFDNIIDSGTNVALLILPASILLLLSVSMQFIAIGLHDALDPKVIKVKR